ncbi:MAG: class C sortase [Ruminococcus sp.]|nr:class C sortase [Ruminococcus sp.]
MKKFIPILIIMLIFLAGVGILSYPLISSVVNNIEMRNASNVYVEKAKEMEPANIKKQFDEANIYNKSLIDNVILTDPFDEEAYKRIGERYTKTFNTGPNGLIGYIKIPKINVNLPIYHGTSLHVLAMGAGHLENTSLPVGGKGTHSVISAHSAYPTETFFDYLTDMKKGDNFYIYVLDRVLQYEVDDINVVLPNDTSNLFIEHDKDYVTLVTCTPYSVNTHRLLVRGKRVPYNLQSETEVEAVSGGEGYLFFFGYRLSYWVVGGIIVGFLLFVAAVVVVVTMIQKHRKKMKHV